MSEHTWTENDFEDMSWHDNHVHALRIREGEYGSGELELDIDYIMEWCNKQEVFEFKILPATLIFKEVTGLRVNIDYATPTAGMTPFSIASIERKHIQREQYVAQIWKILINWPNGEIEFEASGYIQRGFGEPILSEGQLLTPAQRGNRA